MATHLLKSCMSYKASLFHQTRTCNGSFAKTTIHQPSRCLWGMLNAVFNKVDNDRIKEVGPNRACAEWLLRCGASVRFQGLVKWSEDYNLLPTGHREKYVIEQVDAAESCIMHIGFPHFAGCNHIQSIKFHHCTYLDDESLFQLADHLKESLHKLQVSSCGDVSEKGLISLNRLHNLKELYLYDLPAVKDINDVIQTLANTLPECGIKYLSSEDLEKHKFGKESPAENDRQ